MDYSTEVRRRFVSASGAGTLLSGAPGVVSGEAEDRALNVWIRFQVEVRDGIVQTARFQAYGCPHTVAAASWLAERLEGASVEALRRCSAQEIAVALKVPVEKLGKLLRLEDALSECRRALEARGSAPNPYGESVEKGQ